MSSYKEGQTHQLVNKFEEKNFKADDLTKMGQSDDLLDDLLGVLHGTHEIKQVKHLINCDANPFIPEGWKVEQHNKGRQLEWNTERIELYLSDNQKDGNHIEGNKLRKELENKPVLNANVLDYLLKNPHLIPEEWKSKYVFFWGTVYRVSGGGLFVRCLRWSGGEWSWSYDWLGSGFGGDNPAVVLAS